MTSLALTSRAAALHHGCVTARHRSPLTVCPCARYRRRWPSHWRERRDVSGVVVTSRLRHDSPLTVCPCARYRRRWPSHWHERRDVSGVVVTSRPRSDSPVPASGAVPRPAASSGLGNIRRPRSCAAGTARARARRTCRRGGGAPSIRRQLSPRAPPPPPPCPPRGPGRPVGVATIRGRQRSALSTATNTYL